MTKMMFEENQQMPYDQREQKLVKMITAVKGFWKQVLP